MILRIAALSLGLAVMISLIVIFTFLGAMPRKGIVGYPLMLFGAAAVCFVGYKVGCRVFF